VADETDDIRCIKCGRIDGPCKDTDCPEAEALPTLPVVAEEDTFEVWFEQYRMQTWLSAGCHKDRGPEPSAAWGLGSRQSLLRGWMARAALSHAPAEAAIVALRAEVEQWKTVVWALARELNCLPSTFSDGNAHVLKTAIKLNADRDYLRAEVAELRKDAERYLWLRNDMATEFGEPWAITRYAPGDERNSDGGTCPLIGEELDAAIDTARATLLGDGGTL
jgi:hypothetical protein